MECKYCGIPIKGYGSCKKCSRINIEEKMVILPLEIEPEKVEPGMVVEEIKKKKKYEVIDG